MEVSVKGGVGGALLYTDLINGKCERTMLPFSQTFDFCFCFRFFFLLCV